MIKASFFSANPAPLDKDQGDKDPGELLTFDSKSAKSFVSVAKGCAEKHGLRLMDQGRREYSSRFPHIESFGVEGSIQRMFVWSAA